MALASILSMACAAPSPAAAAAAEPEGYIDMFYIEDCVAAKDSEGTQATLIQGKCVDFNGFLSFRGRRYYVTQGAQRIYQDLSQVESRASPSVPRTQSHI